jgi:hypothetical protein
MQFLQQIFNLSPDGGNGMTELAIMLVIVLAVSIYRPFRRVRRDKLVKRLPTPI